MREAITIPSPAKVNYFLKVVKRLPSGYHEIINIMSAVSLFDEVTIELAQSGIEVSSNDSHVPAGSKNTAYRAVEALLRASGKKTGVRIFINKRIPMESGLGGASSNAASAIRGLGELLGLVMTREELLTLAISVGSDVPFFIFGSPAVATGIGESLARVEGIPEAWLIIVKPQGGISTAEAYKRLDLGLTDAAKNIIIPKFNGTLEGLVMGMVNDFEPLIEERLVEVPKIKRELLTRGALGAMLTGSGSAVFGVFTDELSARAAYAEIRSQSGWAVFLVRNVFN